MVVPEGLECGTRGRAVAAEDGVRREAMDGLDQTKPQTCCCPHCGCRLETVFVANE